MSNKTKEKSIQISKKFYEDLQEKLKKGEILRLEITVLKSMIAQKEKEINELMEPIINSKE